MKRQGDLLILEVDTIPQGATPQENRILAEGEQSGHLHELSEGIVYEKKGTLYFAVTQGMEVQLTHPEHDTLIFTPGKYKVVRQREYLPQGWRHVTD